jgi:hypothetical protein
MSVTLPKLSSKYHDYNIIIIISRFCWQHFYYDGSPIAIREQKEGAGQKEN